MSSEAKQVKVKNKGIIYTFTKIGNKYSKIYDSENGYPIYFSYKNEKAWLSAIKKYKKQKLWQENTQESILTKLLLKNTKVETEWSHKTAIRFVVIVLKTNENLSRMKKSARVDILQVILAQNYKCKKPN